MPSYIVKTFTFFCLLLWLPINLSAERRSSDLTGNEEILAFGQLVSKIWNHEGPSQMDLSRQVLDAAQAVYLAPRSRGYRQAEAWALHGNSLEALRAAVRDLQQNLPPRSLKSIDTIEIFLVRSSEVVDLEKDRKKMSANIHRGVFGFEMRYQSIVERFSPTYIIASNRKFGRLLEMFQEKHALSETQMEEDVEYRLLKGEQILVRLGSPVRAHLLERGNQYVPASEVTRQNLRRWIELSTSWLTRNINEEGRLTYLYWPSALKEAPGRNNMIRQWMATVSLGQAATALEDPALWRLAERNIDYNLRNFYREEGDFGLIELRKKVKLGAVAIAAMALIEHPNRQKWSEQEKALRRTIDLLWNENGSFDTFYRPRYRRDNQNFYPGEALFFWSQLYKVEEDEELLNKIMKSFEYYRAWHLNERNRNPAFVPWHTQAYFALWETTRNPELRDFIFTMNDWLLGMQQWQGDVQYRDTLGRFYDPDKPFGPPHASSTGVYLEGLVDAYKLARATGDKNRSESYRISILRGLRSLMQLQFVDEVDMYYVGETQRKYVKGGLRTTVYDNQIRCDNVQHALMAALKIYDTFSTLDYANPKLSTTPMPAI